MSYDSGGSCRVMLYFSKETRAQVLGRLVS